MNKALLNAPRTNCGACWMLGVRYYRGDSQSKNQMRERKTVSSGVINIKQNHSKFAYLPPLLFFTFPIDSLSHRKNPQHFQISKVKAQHEK